MYLIVALLAFLAGLVQTITGFGAGIVMMAGLPYLFPIAEAPSLSTIVCLALSGTLFFRLRKFVEWKKVLLPWLCFNVFSLTAVRFLPTLNLHGLTIAFGIFLIVVAVYLLFFEEKMSFQPTVTVSLLFGAISGVCNGFFGIGGPLMALYYLKVAEDRKSYLADLQFFFFSSGILSLLMRIASGLVPLRFLAYAPIGIIAILLGKKLGLKVSEKIDAKTFRRLVCIVTGLSGVITLIQQL